MKNKIFYQSKLTFNLIVCIGALFWGFQAHATDADTAEETSKKLADPTSDIWALFTAFQATGFSGSAVEGRKWGGTVLIEPVMPITLNSKVKLLTRPALPIAIGMPIPNGKAIQGDLGNTYSGVDYEYGLGNMQLPLMFTPNKKSTFTWGIGPSFIIPTNTDDSLGDDVWEAGLATVGVYKPSSTFTFGAMAQYWWSINPDTEEEDNSHAQIVVFGWQELGHGKSVGFGPTITYDAKKKEPSGMFQLVLIMLGWAN